MQLFLSIVSACGNYSMVLYSFRCNLWLIWLYSWINANTGNKYWQYVFLQNHEHVETLVFFVMFHNVEFYYFFCGDNVVFAVWLMLGAKITQSTYSRSRFIKKKGSLISSLKLQAVMLSLPLCHQFHKWRALRSSSNTALYAIFS